MQATDSGSPVERSELSRQGAGLRQAKQSAARADIEEGLAVEPLDFQHRAKRSPRQRDSVVIEYSEKSRPILPELEAFSRLDLYLLLIRLDRHGFF